MGHNKALGEVWAKSVDPVGYNLLLFLIDRLLKYNLQATITIWGLEHSCFRGLRLWVPNFLGLLSEINPDVTY